MSAVRPPESPRPASFPLRIAPPGLFGLRRARLLIERNLMVYRRTWIIIVSGLGEPLFYLLSIGVGIGKLVGRVSFVGGHSVPYTVYIAPALLASSAMNGALYDSTFNVFFKLHYAKTYDAILATPVEAEEVAAGEIGWALLRGAFYATVFLIVMAIMGLLRSWWALAALPSALLIGFAFAAVGMAATTFMASWQDFDFVQLAILPLFLFSGTFYPLSRYPRALQLIVECTPLFHGVALLRGLTTGVVGWGLAGHAAYLVAMGLIGLRITGRRLRGLLLS